MAEVEEPEGGPNEKSWPVPLRATLCVLPATPLSLSVMVSVPVRVPVAAGVKVTLIVQLAAAATLAPQLLVWAKSPLVATEETVRGPVPMLVSVTGWGALGVPTPWPLKVRLVTDRLTLVAEVPVPFSEMICVEFATLLSLSVIVIVAMRPPTTVGLKVTLIVQGGPLGATVVPEQFSPIVKSPGFGPPSATVLITKFALPGLVNVTDCVLLLVPRSWFAKVKLVPESEAIGTCNRMETVLAP